MSETVKKEHYCPLTQIISVASSGKLHSVLVLPSQKQLSTITLVRGNTDESDHGKVPNKGRWKRLRMLILGRKHI